MKSDLDTLENVFKAVADATRIRILGLLLAGEVCVCHIHESLRIPQSKASRHLAYLRRAGLVETEKRGLWVYYRLAPQPRGVGQTLVNAITHCIGHLAAVKKDGVSLEARTGCCVPAPGKLTMACCVEASQSRRRGI